MTENLLLGKQVTTVGITTFVGFLPPLTNLGGLTIVDFSIINQWTRSGTHLFLIHNNSLETVPLLSVKLAGANRDSPSINYQHRPENEIASSYDPLAGGEYKFVYGSLRWKTFGHLLENISSTSFNLGVGESAGSSEGSLRVKLLDQRIALQVLGIFLNDNKSLLTVRIQNQSEYPLFQSRIELAIMLKKGKFNQQHIFLCNEREMRNTKQMEPMQIGEVEFLLDSAINLDELTGFVCNAFAYRPRSNDESALESETGSALVVGPGGGSYETKPTAPEAAFDWRTLKAKMEIQSAEMEKKGIWKHLKIDDGFLYIECFACLRQLSISQHQLLSDQEVLCDQCVAESNGLRIVELVEVNKYRTRQSQIPEKRVEITYRVSRQRVDVQCLFCDHVDEVAFETLVRKMWWCPTCPDESDWLKKVELARRVQSARRINNIASHKNRFEQFENPPGLLARLSRKNKRRR
jgi:hypothetical protein